MPATIDCTMTPRTLPAAWSVLKRAMATETPLACCVTHVVPGGLQVQVESLVAFLPKSQLELGKPFELESYLGLTLQCHVLRMQPACLSVVVGRQNLLRGVKKKRQDIALQRIQPDTVIEGTVKKLVDYGAFVDLDGVDGLIKNHQLAWSKCHHPSEHVQIGQRVKVRVLTINCVERQIELSLKEARPEPWQAVNAWAVTTRLQGTLVRAMDYGYFVRLSDGVEGLLHINNMKTPKPIFDLNSSVEVAILSIDADKKRISLVLVSQ